MIDIVLRLRDMQCEQPCSPTCCIDTTRSEAADEIERQRVLLDRAADELERISMPEDDVDGLVVELRAHQQFPSTEKP